MRYRIKVEWENKDGSLEAAELGEVQTGVSLRSSGNKRLRPESMQSCGVA